MPLSEPTPSDASIDESNLGTTQGSQAMYRNDMLLIIPYLFLFIVCIATVPFLFYKDCSSGPQTFSHLIFVILQVGLLLINMFIHAKKKSRLNSDSVSMLSTQSRCCREIITQMKLINTYTNFCFAYIVIQLYMEDDSEDYDEEVQKSFKKVPAWLALLLVLALATTVVSKAGAAVWFCYNLFMKVEEDGKIPVTS